MNNWILCFRCYIVYSAWFTRFSTVLRKKTMDYRDFGMSKRSLRFWGLFECFLSIVLGSFWGSSLMSVFGSEKNYRFGKPFGEAEWEAGWVSFGLSCWRLFGDHDENRTMSRVFCREPFDEKFCRGVNLVEEPGRWWAPCVEEFFCREVLSVEMSRTGWVLSDDENLL